MSEDRRVTDTNCWDAALVMAILYTCIFGGFLVSLMFIDIPGKNEKTVDILAGVMVTIQVAIVGYFFGRTKSSDESQKLIAASKERTDSAMREIVSSVKPVESVPKVEPTVPKTVKGRK